MRTTTLLSGLLVLAGLAPSASSSAQEVRPTAAPHSLSEYGGVTPGRANPPPAASRIGRRTRGRRPAPASIVTWPGFQMTPGGGSRFFVQTSAAVAASVTSSSGRVEVLFPNTAIHLSNSGRWLETQFFETPVMRARFERRGHDMVLVMMMRAEVLPQLSTGSENGYVFTYIDFAQGRYRPAEMAPVIAPPARTEGGSVRAASPASQEAFPADDNERPPSIR